MAVFMICQLSAFCNAQVILTWREHPFIINEDRSCLEIAEITFCGLAAEDYFLRKR